MILLAHDLYYAVDVTFSSPDYKYYFGSFSLALVISFLKKLNVDSGDENRYRQFPNISSLSKILILE